VFPGAECAVTATSSRKAPGAWEIRLSGRGRPLARLVAGPTAERIAPGFEDLVLKSDAEASPMRGVPAEVAVDGLAIGRPVAGRYRAGEDLFVLSERLGAGALSAALADGLAWASYVVGMELPGLHSLFSGVTLAVRGGSWPERADSPQPARSERYELELRDHDPRTGQLDVVGVLGDRSGTPTVAARIESFIRVPAGPPDPAALGTSGPGAPAVRGTVAVIGASRGFGASLSLALLARGYEVHGAYATSSESAGELVRLAGNRSASLHLHRVDARDPDQVAALTEAAGPRPLAGLVLGAALPPVPMGVTSESARDLADYLAGSIMLAAVPLGALLPRLESDGGWIVFVSSSALSAPPRDWPHYVTAKAALEGLASWVAQTHPRLRTVVLRPPAMRTEMTNTPSGQIAAVAPETIATWVADQLAGGELPEGLTTLEPGS
jgi:NAD(P)-dependent dehydrogenase (short-subunit alcohol dehydrogenase family)